MRILPLFRYTTAAAILAVAHAGAAAPITVTFQNGANQYEGGFERRIAPGGGESNGVDVTGAATFYVDGGADATDDAGFSNAMIRFDNVQNLIPAGAKIINAKLTLTTKTHSNAQSGNAISVYRLSRPFNELSSAMTGGDFGTDGIRGDIDLFVGSFYGMNTASSVVSADVTDAVQSWINGSPNYGVGLRTDVGTDAWSFCTSGSAQALRPKLEVTYTLDDEFKLHRFQQGRDSYAGTTDIFLNSTGATVTTPGATRKGRDHAVLGIDGVNPPTTQPDIPAMIRFANIETQLAGRKIESAKLKFVTGFGANANSGGPFTVHRMLTPFTEDSTYGNFAGVAGAMVTAGQISAPIATISNNIPGGRVVEIDIADTLKAWLAGEPNNGFYVGAGTENAWEIWTSGAFRNVNGSRVDEIAYRPMLEVITSPALPVEIVAPPNSSRHVLGTTFTFEANAVATSPSVVTKVEFFINGLLVGSDTNAPFTFNYPADKLGNYTLTAVMTDSSAATVTSDAVSFSVVPATGVGGIYFDGIGDQIALGDPAALKLSTFTIETWFRRETVGRSTTTGTGGVVAIPLVAKGRNQAENSTLDTNWFLGIRASDGVLCADFEGAAGANVPVAGRTEIPYGAWQHAAATFDGTKWRLYLNGSLEAELDAGGRTPRADSIQHASIATAMNSNGLGEGAFGGFMDEVRIWNAARTQAQVRAAINTEIVSDPALVARWAMSEGTGTTITSTATAGTVGSFGGEPIWTTGQAYSGNVLPSVALTSPLEGSHYTSSDAPVLSISANDPDGSISKVEYFDNGISIGVVNSAPFSLPYTNLPPGVRKIDAEVTDNNGGTGRIDNPVTIYVSYPSPSVPGYSAGIINGGDLELFIGFPPAVPAPWAVVAGTAAPRDFTNLGTASGDIAVNINGSPAAYNAGLVLTTNAVVDGNFAPNDNIAAPYASGSSYHVRNLDNNGPGETEPEVTPESSSFSLGWFPYANGWIGANVLADGTIDPMSSNLPQGVSITSTALGTYTITGLTETGNLIAVATGADADNFASTTLVDGKWTVLIRDNNGNAEAGSFAFLYVPVSANRVISGLVDNAGAGSPLNVEAQLIGVNAELTPQGYEITFGDGSVINPSNTALFISADVALGNGADNAYSYSANGNSFVVFSHDLPGFNLELQTGGFRFLAVPLNPTNPVPVEVGVRATVDTATENSSNNQLVFTVTRSGYVDTGISVNYTVGGTAIAGSDYPGLSGSVLIPAGAYSAQIVVNVTADPTLEQTETVTISLNSGTGYALGATTSATGWINDSAPEVATSTVTFQQGVNSYTGTFQKRVGIDRPDTSDQTTTYINQLGSAVGGYDVDGGDPDINDMIRFDNIIGSAAGQIPSGAKILKAELVLTTGTGSNDQSGGPFIVDRLVSGFDAATTYEMLSGGSGLEGVRGISSRVPVAGFPAMALGQVGAADVTEIVRAWASGQPNHGFGIFAAGTSDAWNYGTLSNTTVANRPKLVVTYTLENTKEYTLTSDKSALFNSRPESFTEDGSTIQSAFLTRATNNTQEAFLKFPVTFGDGVGAIPLGAKIVKAELLVKTTGAGISPSSQTIAPVEVRQVLTDWNTSTNFGLHGPRTGTNVTESSISMIGLGQDSTTYLDITSYVRNWQAGAPNNGVHLRTSTADNWSFVWPGNTFVPGSVPRLRITVLDESAPVETPFEIWAESQDIENTDLDSDDDHDGIKLLVEYALGLSAKNHDVLPALTRDGSNLTISFPKGADAAADDSVTYEIMSSVDLVEWIPETSAVQTNGAISLTHPAGDGPKFFRLKVTYTP